MADISDEIKQQCAEVSFDSSRPLIISDADEVLLQFMVQFEHYLDKQDLWIDLQSFKLNGNIKHKGTQKQADVNMPDLLDAFLRLKPRISHLLTARRKACLCWLNTPKLLC